MVLQETQDFENVYFDSHPEDEEVSTACDELASRRLLQRCETCGRNCSSHHFKSESKAQCTQCFKSGIPNGIQYQGEELKTVYGKTPIQLLGIHHNMWLDAKTQRRKVIDAAIAVAAYLYKNDNLRIDQRLKVISMCLPSIFSFSAPLIDWPESDLKLLPAGWVRTYKDAWNVGKSTATCLFTFPREKGGLQVKLPFGTLFTSVWGNLERCSQFDDGTRQMLAICYQEVRQENGCLDLFELQDASQHLSKKAARANEVIFAYDLARQRSPHTITSIQAGSMIACNGNALVGELITHIDSIPSITMNHNELHRALQGPEYTSVSLGIADPQGNAQTISVLRNPSKTSQISWARSDTA